MKKNEIIRGLQKLSPSRIKILDIIYHKDTPEGSIRFIYNYSSSSSIPFCDTPLCEVLMSLYKLRRHVREIYLVYCDPLGQLQEFYWTPRDCMYCSSLSDFINIKNIKNGKIY